MTAAEARNYLTAESGKRYDGQVVSQFLTWLENPARAVSDVVERKSSIGSLNPGNKLSRDICDPNGVLVIAKNKVITEILLLKLRRLQDSFSKDTSEYIRDEKHLT